MKRFEKIANSMGKERRPFFFLIDFEKQKPIIYPIEECGENEIFFNINGVTNYVRDMEHRRNFKFESTPIPFEDYKKGFDKVQSAIKYGDTYLTNLCYPSKVETDLTLEQIFFSASARFKLLFQNRFVSFSPEAFVSIKNNYIHTFPMKGTISASLPGAKDQILNDPKEAAEHATIVDFLRNDLNMISTNVTVSDYRYIEKLMTWNKALYQVSSKITGKLPKNYNEHIGTLLNQLTPAGSISGAPKKRTLEIIRDAEGNVRGYFTGIFGIFDVDKDGNFQVDSGVLIRYMDQVKSYKDLSNNDMNQYRYWSGGGITNKSDALSEYKEMISKVYVPIY